MIDLAVNARWGSGTGPAGGTKTDYRLARDGKDRAVRLFRFPADACMSNLAAF